MASDLFSYRLTSDAESDIDEIFSYITNDLSNPEAAASFADELVRHIRTLCHSPKIGTPVINDYLLRDDIRKIFVRNYIVYYGIDEESQNIIILRVVYSKRNQNLILADL